MYPDKLYQLAFAFRKTNLWKSLYESELFAVALPDGEIGYCCVMGSGGEHLALALYVGNKGLDTFRIMQGAGEVEAHPLKAYETMLSQDSCYVFCIAVVFIHALHHDFSSQSEAQDEIFQRRDSEYSSS